MANKRHGVSFEGFYPRGGDMDNLHVYFLESRGWGDFPHIHALHFKKKKQLYPVLVCPN